jgi:carbonic anhydrase
MTHDIQPAELLQKNKDWALAKTRQDEGFFRRLVAQQTPQYLWIGCADSRVPANEIIGLDPGEVFVHRNVANLASPQDANCLSVLQYAVEVLEVRHVLVVGHYGCGGVRAALESTNHGLIDHWLSPVRELAREQSAELARYDDEVRVDRLCELNVVRQVRNVASNPFVTAAWARGQQLSVHGWIYALHDGILRDLGVTCEREADFLRWFAPAPIPPSPPEAVATA